MQLKKPPVWQRHLVGIQQMFAFKSYTAQAHSAVFIHCYLPLHNSTRNSWDNCIMGESLSSFPSIILPIFSWLPQTSCAHSAHFALTNGTLWVLAISLARMPRRKRNKLFTYNWNEISKKRSDNTFFLQISKGIQISFETSFKND